MIEEKLILVTGGTGFIGSHTVVELQQAGHEVLVLDDLSNSRIEVLDAIAEITGKRPHFEQVDITDREALEAVFSKYQKKIEGVIHFAAKKAVGESVEFPLMYYRINVGGTVNLLECMAAHGVSNIVFSSSCTVYGQPDVIPVDESAPRKQAESPYGNTKSICEDVLRDASASSPLKVVALRYFNPIGAHDSALIGELPLGTPNNLVPYITQTGIGKREQLTVHGNDYPTTDGTCIRDYIHVVDLAKAHLAALDRLIDKKQKTAYEVFNIGTGSGSSVLEVIHTFEKVSGQKLNYRIGPRRAGDITQVYADTTYSNTELGWRSELNLEDALRSAWAWEVAISKGEIA
jgi:UDP-glucose 4-epimerase